MTDNDWMTDTIDFFDLIIGVDWQDEWKARYKRRQRHKELLLALAIRLLPRAKEVCGFDMDIPLPRLEASVPWYMPHYTNGCYGGGTVSINTQLFMQADTAELEGVVLHELVHYVQDEQGRFPSEWGRLTEDGIRALETQAYNAQMVYLMEKGVPVQPALYARSIENSVKAYLAMGQAAATPTELVMSLLIFAGEASGLPVPLPGDLHIRYAEPCAIHRTIAGEQTPCDTDGLHAFAVYNNYSNTVWLPTNIDWNDWYHRSYVVHELVHYLQDMNHVEHVCPEKFEKQAYDVQGRYLSQNGLEIPLDRATLAMLTSCPASLFGLPRQ